MCASSPNTSSRDVGVVIAAAGVGERAGAGAPKQFRPIAGVPLLLRAVRPFVHHARVAQIVVALPPRYVEQPPDWLARLVADGVRLVAGGPTRADSVRLAVLALPPQLPVVLVHDAARPFVSPQTVDAVIAVARRGVAAVPAVPVSDTLKRVEPGGMRVATTVDRRDLWRAQTPQGFPQAMLRDAYRATDAATLGDTVTDEAALVEACQQPVEIVPDQASNFKVTTPEDFRVAELLAVP